MGGGGQENLCSDANSKGSALPSLTTLKDPHPLNGVMSVFPSRLPGYL